MTKETEIRIPDIGGASKVDVIELLVKEGDTINVDTPLITLESDKASMEIPSPIAGLVSGISVKIGDKVSEGDLILYVKAETNEVPVKIDVSHAENTIEHENSALSQEESTPATLLEIKQPPESLKITKTDSDAIIFAGPAVRRMARELGVDLSLITGSGRKTRITKEDLQSYVKERLSSQPVIQSGFGLPQSPVIDFSRFGDIESKPLNKIKKLTGLNVHNSWISIPHVTQFDEADITDLEAFRKAETEAAKNSGIKLTLLAFVCAVVCKALRTFPQFNASLDAKGEQLIYKKYYNIGIAVETPNGLVVPVIRQVDKLSVNEIALEMTRLSAKARDKGLLPNDMSGGCFTISSLGGIGGTSFTPIVNSPEVAILGLSRSSMKPVYKNGQFEPRLMLPLSLSYDHRVIDGAEAARFTRYLCEHLADVRRILL